MSRKGLKGKKLLNLSKKYDLSFMFARHCHLVKALVVTAFHFGG